MLARILLLLLVSLLSPSVFACGANSPPGVEGEIIFLEEANVPAYCDGSDWIAMVGSSGSYVANAVDLDNGHPRVSNTNVIIPETQKITASMWFRRKNLEEATDFYFAFSDRCIGVIYEPESSLIRFRDSAGDDVIQASIGATPGYFNHTDWTHLMFSFDSSQAGVHHLYIDGLAATDTTWTNSSTSNSIACDNGSLHIAGATNNNSRDYEMADFWMDFDTYIDLSNPSERVKFINNDDKPVFLGNNGELPTATSPHLFFSGDADNWHINKGTAGGFDEIGTIIEAPYGPSKEYITQIVPDGLIGHWRLDETSGTTALDSSGNGNHGTINGNVELGIDSPIGGGIRTLSIVSGFEDDGRIEIPGVFPTGINVPFSVAAWVQRDAGFKTIWSNGLQSESYQVSFRDQSDCSRNIGFGCHTVKYSSGETNPNTPMYGMDVWQHLTLTYDGSIMRIYSNGNISDSWSRSITFTNPNFSIGSGGGPFGNAGVNLDDVRLYDRPLTPAEIAEIYTARDGIRYNGSQRTMEFFDGNRFVAMTPAWPEVTDGLIGHWKLDEATGTTAVNSANPGTYNGTMLNGLNAAEDSTRGAVGTGLYFNARQGQYINLGSAITSSLTTGEATFAAWVKFRSGISSFSRIFDYGNITSPISIDPNNSGSLRCDHPGISAIITGSNIYNRDELTHVACVFRSDGVIEHFINGVSKGTNPTGATFNFSTSGTSKIGSNGFQPTGIIDDVRLYDRALTPSEMMDLFQMGTRIGSSTALPQGCPNIGDVCDDGTIYAGLSPDGNVEMYHNTKDLGRMPWNNGNTTGFVFVPSLDNVSGETNTNILVVTDADSDTAGFQPHQAAHACYNLVSNGADDWYLPQRGELERALGTNKTLTDGHGGYWTSHQRDANNSDRRGLNIETGAINSGAAPKSLSNFYQLRCVRKGPAPRCANPYGLEGQKIYNTSYDVVQYCDGARWIAIGKNSP